MYNPPCIPPIIGYITFMTKSTNFRVGTHFRVFLDPRSSRWSVYDYRIGLIVAENFKTDHAARWWAKTHG